MPSSAIGFNGSVTFNWNIHDDLMTEAKFPGNLRRPAANGRKNRSIGEQSDMFQTMRNWAAQSGCNEVWMGAFLSCAIRTSSSLCCKPRIGRRLISSKGY